MNGRSLFWPLSRLGEGLEQLLAAAGLIEGSHHISDPDPDACGIDQVRRHLVAASESIGLELVEVESIYRELDEFLQRIPPAVIRARGAPGEEDRLVLLARSTFRGVVLIDEDGRERLVEVKVLKAMLVARSVQEQTPAIEAMLDMAGVRRSRRVRVRKALLEERLGSTRLGDAFLLRPPARASVRQLAKAARLPKRLAAFLLVNIFVYALTIIAWRTIGAALLDDRLDTNVLFTWILILVTSIPASMWATTLGGEFVIAAGTEFKRRIIEGALSLDPDEIRSQGAGQLLGRVMEANLVESMTMSGGVNALTTIFELAGVVYVILQGPVPGAQLAILAIMIAASLILWRRLFRSLSAQMEARLDLTHETIEEIVGHRTRLVEEEPSRWHVREDDLLARYFALCRVSDRRTVVLLALIPRCWLILSILALAPTLTEIDVPLGPIAIAFGAALLGSRAIGRASSSLYDLTFALIAWKHIAPVFHAAARDTKASPEAPIEPAIGRETHAPSGGSRLVLAARDLVFRYPGRARAVLEGASLTVKEGDRVLLEGVSGGGKSTLFSLLLAIREPESGLLLLDGLDLHALGRTKWRQKIVAAPQFHENRVFSDSLAFNLLLGRCWPAGPDDLLLAREVCEELGLGPLIARMPSGLDQLVGDTGWQLSHGEQSRVFIARTLLQSSRVILLDESFGALDPETMRLALRCVLKRAPALIVIAHP